MSSPRAKVLGCQGWIFGNQGVRKSWSEGFMVVLEKGYLEVELIIELLMEVKERSSTRVKGLRRCSSHRGGREGRSPRNRVIKGQREELP